MSWQEYRDLGMDRKIARRDFLNGVAIGVTGTWAGLRSEPSWAMVQRTSGTQDSSNYYPALTTGLRGNYPEAIDEFPRMQQGAYAKFPAFDVDTKEEYDLVVIGGGFSGLSAAYFWRRALGNSQKVLVLDNHDDFGGHANRNEFRWQGRTYIAAGGTAGISTPYPYSYTAKSLILDLGIQVERGPEFASRDLEKYNLSSGTFFDKERFGVDKLVVGGRQNWEAFLAQAPISATARKDLIRLYGGKHPDYMAGMSQQEKKAKLANMSYQDFLLKYVKITPDALLLVSGGGGRNSKKIDTMPALEAAMGGAAGFEGLGLERERTSVREGPYSFRFPDGAHSVARLLVKKLLPDAVSGEQSMDTIVHAQIRYAKFDQANSTMRLRLSSQAVRVQHEGDPETSRWIRVAYVRDGKMHGVRARNVILACYNSLIPSLMPELPARQKEALGYAVKVPQCPISVFIRRWTAFQKAGVSSIDAPGMYLGGISLSVGSTVGGYRGVTTPDEPIIARLGRSPSRPGSGLPRREQLRAAQQELLSTTFEHFELEVRRHFARMVGPFGFDPANDILAITVNRWPYGYSYTYDTLGDPDVPQEQRPHVVGRQRFGLVTIANSDAGAAAFINQAIDEAHRAVQELLVSNGLTESGVTQPSRTLSRAASHAVQNRRSL